MDDPSQTPGRGKARRRTPAGPGLALALAVVVGVASGLGAFAFNFAEGASYLSADPRACANCHIMQPQFDSWQKASHHTSATCADCHLPHAFLPKYLAKAENGWHHSAAVTLQNFDEPIRIKGRNIQSLQDNCVRCHGELTHPQLTSGRGADDVLPCVHCHASAGHGEKAGLGGRRAEAAPDDRKNP